MFIRGTIATYPGDGKRESKAEEQKRRVAKGGERTVSMKSSALSKHVVLVGKCAKH